MISLYHYRHYVVSNAWLELKHRYAGSSLGAMWNVLLPLAEVVAQTAAADLFLFSSVKADANTQMDEVLDERKTYLQGVQTACQAIGLQVSYAIRPGSIATAAGDFVAEKDLDLVITTTRGKSGSQHWLTGGVSRKLAEKLDIPILLVKAVNGELPKIERILVALDGSIKSEHTLPYARAMAKIFNCELILLSVPAVPEISDYRAAADVIESLRHNAEVNMGKFLDAVARSLREDGISVRTMVTGNRPSVRIVEVAEEEDVDLIMITSRGRGGMDLLMMGSEAHRIIERTERPVFLVPVHADPQ